MSDTSPPPVPPAPHEPPYQYVPPPPVPRSGCATAFMVLFGVILLLPGLCALLVGGSMMSDGHVESAIVSLVLLGLLVGAGGVILIYAAIKGRAR